jgi:hypothetical protein
MKLKVNSKEQVTQTRFIETENNATNIFDYFVLCGLHSTIVKFDTNTKNR